MGTFGTPSSYNNNGTLGSATNPTTAQGLSRDRENQKAILELPGTQAWVEKTITDGVIIPTSAEVIVLPEGGAPTDSLTTIALTSDGTTTLHEGMPIRLKAANSDTITVVHGTGTNNISTIDGNNVVLDTTWYLELKLINGLWVQQETHAYKIAAASSGLAPRMDAVEAVAASAKAVTDLTTVTPGAGGIPKADTNGKIDPRWYGTPSRLFASFNTSEPDGLLANGGAYSRTTYAALFAILGTSFGAGNGSTTFKVPDFRGRTLQGANANLMAVLDAGLPDIIGDVARDYDVGFIANDSSVATGAFVLGERSFSNWCGASSQSARSIGFRAGASNAIYGASTTVQPPAIAVNIFIKY